MKIHIFLHLAALLMALQAYAATSKPGDGPAEAHVLDPTPYGWDRYTKLTEKSPFEFDKAPPPPAAAVDQFADWGIVGVSKHTDSSSVTIMNIKTSERVRITKGAGVLPAKSNAKKSTDTYTLEDLKFEEGKPQLIKHAIATVTKNGAMGTVKYSEQAIKMVRAANPQPAAPKPGNPAGTPASGSRPGAAGTGAAPGSNPVMNMIQGQNQGGAPQAVNGAGNAQPPQNPSIPAQAPSISGVPTPPTPPNSFPPPNPNTAPTVRRRVVLPDNNPGNPPKPLDTTPHKPQP